MRSTASRLQEARLHPKIANRIDELCRLSMIIKVPKERVVVSEPHGWYQMVTWLEKKVLCEVKREDMKSTCSGPILLSKKESRLMQQVSVEGYAQLKCKRSYP